MPIFRKNFKSAALQLLVLALLANLPMPSLAQEAPRVIASTPPTAAPLHVSSSTALAPPRVNAVGEFAFIKGSTVWVGNGETTRATVSSGPQLAGLPAETRFVGHGILSNRWLGFGRTGRTVTAVRLDGGAVSNDTAVVLLSASESEARIFGRPGVAWPNGVQSAQQVLAAAVNERGNIAFGYYDSPSILEGSLLAAGTPESLTVWRGGKAVTPPALFADGRVAFIGQIDPKAGTPEKVFVGEVGGPQAILGIDDPAPGIAGEVLVHPNQAPSLLMAAEPQGRIVIGGYTRRADEFPSARLAIWEGHPDRLQLALRAGQVVAGVQLQRLREVHVNAAGDLIVSGSDASDVAVVLSRRANVWSVVARAGQPAPGLEASARYQFFDTVIQNAQNQIAIWAMVSGSARANHGLWGGTPDDVRLLLSSGDVVSDNGQSRVVGIVHAPLGVTEPAFGQPGGNTPLGDNGLLLIHATMRDGGEALLSMVLPAIRPRLADDRMLNISTRARISGGESMLIAGFVVAGDQPQQMLVRGIGPALTGFGVAGALASPELRLFRGSEEIAVNRGWSTASNASTIAAAAVKVGAFNLVAGAADSALLTTLPPGTYTAQLSGVGGAVGVGLVEVYHLSDPAQPGRPINLSSRAFVGQGAEVLIPGIVISGTSPKTLLIRAVGPTLATDFGLGGTLADPQMVLFADGTAVASNNDWNNSASAATIRDVAKLTGAFALREGSKDAAMLVSLSPGTYTLQVKGRDDGVGVALVEVYEVGTP